MKDRIKRLDTIAVDRIVGFSGGNPKKRDDRDRAILDSSLDTHGYLIPVAVRELPDGRFELIDGHGRVDSIRNGRRAEQIKVLVLDVESVAEGRRVLLALKHTADWDFTQLENFVRDTLADGASLDEVMSTSGLTSGDLDALGEAGLAQLEEMAREIESNPSRGTVPAHADAKQLEQDEVPTPPKNPTTKAGDVWSLGDSVLICGDCQSVDTSRLRLGRLGFALSSPPYNAGKNVERAVKGKAGGDSRYNEPDDMDADAYAELLDASTKIMLESCAVAAINLQSLAQNKRVIARWAARWSNRLIDRAVWVKTSAQPAINPTVMNSSFEDIYIYSNADRPKRTIPTARFHGTVANVHSGPGAARDNDYADVHGATMPVHLAQWAIEQLGGAADFIVDVFGGTGTTLVVAEQLGKRAALVERDRAYCDIIVERWQKISGGKAKLVR